MFYNINILLPSERAESKFYLLSRANEGNMGQRPYILKKGVLGPAGASGDLTNY
jgi:hypothetical protein